MSWRAKRGLFGEVDGKHCIAAHVHINVCRTFIYIYIYIYKCVPYFHIYICVWRTFIAQRVECATKILWTRLKKVNGRLGKPAMDRPDSSMKKKMAADSKAQGKKQSSTCSLLG